jgi:hypothetical protein
MNSPRSMSALVVLAALLTLTSAAQSTPMTLTTGVPVSGISGAAGSQQSYVINVPGDQSLLNITTSGGTGDCQVYSKYNAEPTTTVYDYWSHVQGSDQSITVHYPISGPWYILLQGASQYTGVTLQASFSPCPGNHAIPAPAALLLTGLGAGVVSRLRRRWL